MSMRNRGVNRSAAKLEGRYRGGLAARGAFTPLISDASFQMATLTCKNEKACPEAIAGSQHTRPCHPWRNAIPNKLVLPQPNGP